MGHSVHQMLIVFPLGLLGTAIAFDLIRLLGGGPEMARVAYWLVIAGLIGGAVAAPFGTIDWLGVPHGTRAKRIGLLHGAGNLAVMALFLLSWLLRRDAPETPPALAYVLSFAGGGLSLVTAWMGGELVARLGVGVSPRADVNAPSSLEHRSW